MKKALFIFIGILFFFSVNSSLAQGIVNVSPLTGTAGVNIPIYTVSNGGVAIPISVSYYGAGVKVLDVESSAGMNWQLSAGGQISRQVRGLPDDIKLTSGGLHPKPIRGWMYNTLQDTIKNFAIANDGGVTCSKETSDINFINSHFSPQQDSEPDRFSVSAPGLSCQLVYDQSISNFRVSPYQDLVVAFTADTASGYITSFTITNGKGVKYTFASKSALAMAISNGSGTVNYLKNTYLQYLSGIKYYDSWYLTSITDVNGNAVTLTYRQGLSRNGGNPVNLYIGGSTSASFQYAVTQTTTPLLVKNIYQGTDTTISPAISFTWKYNHTLGYHCTYQFVVSTIKGRGLNLNFNYSPVGWTTDAGPSYTYIRLFLRSLQDTTCGSPINYNFSYAQENYTSGAWYTQLPDSSERLYDYWGYYNGNHLTIPGVYVNPLDTTYQRYAIQASSSHGSSYTFTAGTNSMAVQTTLISAGSLVQIKYPQAGTTTINYESNDYLDVPSGTVVNGGGIRVKQVVDYDGIDTAHNIVRNYSYLDTLTHISSGKPISLPVYAFTIPYSGPATGQSLWTNATAISDLDLSNDDHTIMYSYVKESQIKAGSTLYSYYIPATNWDKTGAPACSGCSTDWRPTGSFVARTNCTTSYPTMVNGPYNYNFAPNANYDFERGLLKTVINYNDAGSKVSRADYTYIRSYSTAIAIPGFTYDTNFGASGTVMAYSKYNTYTSTGELTAQVVSKLYDPSGGTYQQSTMNYAYGSSYHKLLTQQSTTNSDGSTVIANIRYTKDYAVAADTNANVNALYNLQQENVNVPVESWSQVQRGATVYTTGASLTLFKGFTVGSNILYMPSRQFKFASPDGYTSFAPLSVAAGGHTLVRDTSYLPVANITAYDSGGTMLTMDDAHHHTQSAINDHNPNAHAITVSNAAYNEIGFSNFDSQNYAPLTNFTLSGTTTYITPGHTGQAAVFNTTQILSSQTIAKNSLTQNYIFSLWINNSLSSKHFVITFTPTGGGSPVSYTKTWTGMGQWQYLEWKLSVSTITGPFTVSVTTNGNTNIDDVTLYPENSEIAYHAYDPVTLQQTAVTNTNGISAYVDYDQWGRPLHTYDQFKNMVQRNTYVMPASGTCGTVAHGYTLQRSIKLAGILTDAQADTLSLPYQQTSKVYVDGLGRSIQAIAVQASPMQNDLIQPMAYDNLGRQLKSYLPYAGKSTDTAGSYRANALSVAQPAFYRDTTMHTVAHDDSAFNAEQMEKSPLQRVSASGMVGAGFQPQGTQHYKTISYRSNNSTADGSIIMWSATGTNAGNYTDHTLSVTDATDEDGSETLVYNDLAGRTVLKRQVTGNALPNKYLDTYYLYNNAGAVNYIVPPKAVALLTANPTYTLSTTVISNLIFKYVYDTYGRPTEKTAPGNLTSYIIYDPVNRPVLTQAPNQRAAKQWSYIKYDPKGRPASSGIYTDATYTTRAGMQNYVNSLAGSYNSQWYETRSTSAVNYYYTDNIFPTSHRTPLANNYYDNYDLNNSGSPEYGYIAQGLPREGTPNTSPIKGMPTMSVRRSIGPGFTSNLWLLNVTFYDKYGHAIQTRSNNQLHYTQDTLTDTKTMVVDFTGRPLISQVVKVTGSSTAITNTIKTTFTYDSNHTRLSRIDQVYNSQASVRIAAYTYNELGQMVEKQLAFNGTKYLQNVNYRFNIRNQLTSINNSKLTSDGGITSSDNSALFGMLLLYDQADSNLSGDVPSYSGRLSAVKWMSRDVNNARKNERSYVYSYDKLGRYTGSQYAERSVTGTGAFNINNHGFDEYNISYDENGNIQTMRRNSSKVNATADTVVDELAYTYDTNYLNRLSKVVDTTGKTLGFNNATGSTGNYTYDNNTGNLTNDPYKGLNLRYNMINRVDSIVTTAGGMHKGYISYTYDGAGQVMRRQVYSDSTHLQSTNDYIDGMVYTDSTLSYMPMPEGRIVDSLGTLIPEYVISDQQGNARFSFRMNTAGGQRIIQENSFYAFGESLANGTVATPPLPNNNLYNGGAERQNSFGNLPDYDQTYYRDYDPAVGRFIAPDPMPESAVSMSNYQYAGNNPVMFNDPLGDLVHLFPPGQINFPQPNGGINMKDFQTGGDALATGEGWDNGYYMGRGGGGDGFGSEANREEYDAEAETARGGNYMDFWNSAISFGNDIASSIDRGEINFSGADFARGAIVENSVTQNPGETASITFNNLTGSVGIDIFKVTASTGSAFDGINLVNLSGSYAEGVVAANQGGEFAPNSAYTIRDGNVAAKSQIGQLLIEYISGTGPERSLFFGNSNIVQKYLRHSIYEATAVNAFFAGGQKPIDHMQVDFNLWEATAEYVINANEVDITSFLGSARMSVTPVGNMLRLQLDNTTNQHSLDAHLPWIQGVPRNTGQLTPQGTTYQRFIWYVEIK